MIESDSYIGHRFEFKYLLDPLTAAHIEAYLERLRFEHDLNSRGIFYTVNSLYFETPALEDYLDKEGALLMRKKVRARIYGPSFETHAGDVWLEIKKKYDMRISKERTRISNDLWRSLMRGDSALPLKDVQADHIENVPVYEAFARELLRYNYRPKIIIRYKRKPYLTRFLSTIRLTLDKEIEAKPVDRGGWGEGSYTRVFQNYTVMEVKFNYTLPWWFKRMIEQFNLSRTDFSKYNLSVDTVYRSYGLLRGR